MKQKILLVLWIAAALLLLCACQQTGALVQQLDEYSGLLQSELKALPTVTPEPPSTPKPTYIPKITPSPKPTERPEASLFPMPTIPAELLRPSPSPSPTPDASPSPTVSASSLPLPTVPPLPSYAPIPQSVPFALYTPTPAPAEPPASEQAPSAAQSSGTAPSATYATGQEVANFALQYVGYDYVYGAESPDVGFDCSGLVYYVYGQFGYSLNRTAAAQALNGVHVDHGSLEPGDVLCFYTSGSYIGHAGLYLGNGEYVHAKGTGYGVVVSPLSERGENYEARRILS